MGNDRTTVETKRYVLFIKRLNKLNTYRYTRLLRLKQQEKKLQ